MTQLIMTACTGNAITADMVYPAIRHCDPANLDYIPADINLASTETLMSATLSRETIFRRILSEDVIYGYDFVIMVDHYNQIGYDVAYQYHMCSTDVTHFTEMGAKAAAKLVADELAKQGLV